MAFSVAIPEQLVSVEAEISLLLAEDLLHSSWNYF